MDYIVYHSKDLDGKCSGAVLLERFNSAELIGYDYGQEFKKLENTSEKRIVMADVTLPPKDLFKLAHDFKELVLIDHHVSALESILLYAEENNIDVLETQFNGLIKEYFFPELNFRYYYSSILSACEICYKLYPCGSLITELKVRLLGQYDTWRNNGRELVNDFNWEEKVLPFQMGARVNETVKEVLSFLYADNINDTITAGEGIIKYNNVSNAYKLSNNSFIYRINGLTILACNGVDFNSQSFKGFYLEEIHDAMMPFVYCGSTNKWNFSLYTTKEDVDLLSIAKEFGGGGHAKACGFSVNEDELVFIDGDLFLGKPPVAFNSLEILEEIDAPTIPQPPKKKAVAKKKTTKKK